MQATTWHGTAVLPVACRTDGTVHAMSPDSMGPVTEITIRPHGGSATVTIGYASSLKEVSSLPTDSGEASTVTQNGGLTTIIGSAGFGRAFSISYACSPHGGGVYAGGIDGPAPWVLALTIAEDGGSLLRLSAATDVRKAESNVVLTLDAGQTALGKAPPAPSASPGPPVFPFRADAALQLNAPALDPTGNRRGTAVLSGEIDRVNGVAGGELHFTWSDSGSSYTGFWRATRSFPSGAPVSLKVAPITSPHRGAALTSRPELQLVAPGAEPAPGWPQWRLIDQRPAITYNFPDGSGTIPATTASAGRVFKGLSARHAAVWYIDRLRPLGWSPDTNSNRQIVELAKGRDRMTIEDSGYGFFVVALLAPVDSIATPWSEFDAAFSACPYAELGLTVTLSGAVNGTTTSACYPPQLDLPKYENCAVGAKTVNFALGDEAYRLDLLTSVRPGFGVYGTLYPEDAHPVSWNYGGTLALTPGRGKLGITAHLSGVSPGAPAITISGTITCSD